MFSQLLKVEVALCLEGVARPELEGLHVPRNLSQHCIAVYSMFNQCCQNILSETFKFIYLQTLSWTLGPFEIDPRESRRRKLKSCRWMRRPTAGFENTVREILRNVCYQSELR